ncbi:MAG: hypothetical protein ACRDMI_16520 [Streptosporangiaceae bacterium]
MSELPDPPPAEPSAFHRERREHGGASARLNDDQLSELTEEERVDAGIDPYEPDEVPSATDDPVPADITESGQYQEEREEIEREKAEGELPAEPGPFPPTRYDE